MCQLMELDTLTLQWALFWSCMWLQCAAVVTTCMEFLELTALMTEFDMHDMHDQLTEARSYMVWWYFLMLDAWKYIQIQQDL